MSINVSLLFVEGSVACQLFNDIIFFPNYTTRIRSYKNKQTVVIEVVSYTQQMKDGHYGRVI
jgi:hypothetical protein